MTDAKQTPITSGTHPVAARRTLRVIAIFEGLKGIVALIAIIGVVDLMRRDVRHLAEQLIGWFGLSPDDHYSSIILRYADLIPGANIKALALLAVAYSTLRLLAAYGLWNDKAWAEWIAALSAATYVPFEIHHLMQSASLISAVVLLFNVLIVAFLSYQLWRRRSRGSLISS